jgi:phosphate transport system permease protein
VTDAGSDAEARRAGTAAERGSFTGRARRRKTSRSVLFAERVARLFITIGGVGTIVAVTTICVFLVWVVVPLFRAGSMEAPRVHPLGGTGISAPPKKLAVDEFGVMCWTADHEGNLVVRRLDDGSIVARKDLFDGEATASAFGIGDGRVAFGFADGTTRAGSVGLTADLVDPAAIPEALRGAAGAGKTVTVEETVFVRLPDGQVRRHGVTASLGPPVAATSKSPVVLLDQSMMPAREMLCVLRGDGSLLIEELTRTTNLLTGEEAVEVAAASLPYEPRGSGPPAFLRITERGDGVYLAWADGFVARYDCRDLAKPALAEIKDIVPDPALTLTSFEFLNGRTTLIAGDSGGGVHGWFPTKPVDAPNPDGIVFERVHSFGGTAAVTAAATSTRSRLFVTGDARGNVTVRQMTTGATLASAPTFPNVPIDLIQVGPKSDVIVALSKSGLAVMRLDPGHAEVTPRTIVLPVWYEGDSAPSHAWQSAGASDDFEPKLGLIPLIFGTIKATFYSLLFAVPIALLAAIYTSEFLHPRTRARVKPAIEMMASLPSVVLGFIASIVLAPLVEGIVPAVLLAFVAVPVTFLVSACLWQLMPQTFTARLAGWPKLLVMAAVLPAGLWLASRLGPAFERVVFAGDVKSWLDGQVGRSTGGFALLLVLPAALTVAMLFHRFLNPRLLSVSQSWTRGQSAVANLVRLLSGAILTVAIAWALGAMLDAAGFDVRKSFFGTYQQRNALIVGFVMGFTVIPIVYTLAEDALSSVPVQLRSASLGCGATPWQTAVRVVLPTALSGIFSAVMVGLGRAVGETMVVLMAAGNTPVLEWSMFSGFRTLAANIAYELPEAAQGGTHYRMLFLAALTLFAITFVLNTIAETIRLRFRKRAFQL